jgi:hypothetical protein
MLESVLEDYLETYGWEDDTADCGYDFDFSTMPASRMCKMGLI